ncbi:phosphoribosyltransferase [Noviherbaspirillum galbum]|uniref:Phosphoribosyltransferase n=1 Tax=Noviherbaspirillum galbum TaxID=2709383 RepID=A0A6B3SPQ8_9BURK|nr:phosphoribosyltransferase [Noviherbaspirillum galbum]NEX62631.1 phosphoribosyltransferase [Noviherbaspirillum galbum]
MTASTNTDLWVSWADYDKAIVSLAAMVHDSGWQFDQVLCLARGGLRPGDIFSRIFDVPLAILSTSSYREEAGKVQGDLDIARHITMTKGSLAGRVLLIDDLVDSGVTLQRVQEHLKQHFPAVTEVRSAVIWCKACSAVRPDFYLQYLETNPWIHQPFEEFDGLRPHQLSAWLRKGETA